MKKIAGKDEKENKNRPKFIDADNKYQACTAKLKVELKNDCIPVPLDSNESDVGCKHESVIPMGEIEYECKS